jgi:peptide deformylase
MIRPILLLGAPELVRPSRAVARSELEAMAELGRDLRDTLLEFRRIHGVGRGIAAPQIGVAVRAVYLHWPEPRLLLNPELDRLSDDAIELWDDCMSFPELLVRVQRHATCRLRYRDESWDVKALDLTDGLSELLQHEVDHLDGILAVARAVGPDAFALRRQREGLREVAMEQPRP